MILLWRISMWFDSVSIAGVMLDEAMELFFA